MVSFLSACLLNWYDMLRKVLTGRYDVVFEASARLERLWMQSDKLSDLLVEQARATAAPKRWSMG